MKKFTIGGIIITLLIAVALVWYVSAQKSQSQPQTNAAAKHSYESLRIGLNPWIGHGLYYVAKEKGFFEKEQVNVVLTNFDSGEVGKQLISTSKVEALSLTPETVIILNDAGVKVKAVAMTDTSVGADGVIVAPEIKSLPDLRGKKVAFEVGSPSHFFLAYLLNQVGLTTDDLEIVDTAAPDAGAAFVSGQVDAAVTWEPWLSKANERQGGYLLANSQENPILPAMPIFRTEVIEKRPQDIRAMLRALFNAREWITQNQNEAVQIIARNFNITEQEVIEQLPTFRWFSYQENVDGFNSGEYAAKNLIQNAGDLWLKLELSTTKVKADGLVDATLLKDLY